MGGRNGCQYIIHACLEREWYVREYLIPSMLEQGIHEDQIDLWLDVNRDGNLFSCMKCFKFCGENDKGGRWHLQDDVVIARDFRERTEEHDNGIVAGFAREEWQTLTMKSGYVPAVYLWNSFQCIRIPDEIAGECAEWFFNDAAYRDTYKEAVSRNKMDDSLFYDFITERHLGDTVLNLEPSLVDHIDFLLGGSVINRERNGAARGDRWQDEEAFEKLKDKLARR